MHRNYRSCENSCLTVTVNSNVYHEEDKMSTVAVQRSKTYDIVYIAVFAVIMAICSWISIPAAVPFTLQTFGVFIAAGVLGGKRGTLSVLVFILLGAVGIPVFANFSGGIGVLAGPTGGYIIGFIAMAIIAGLVIDNFHQPWLQLIGMIVGTIICYALGTAWFCFEAKSTVSGALSICVFPFIPGDLIKMVIAMLIGPAIKKRLR